MTSQPELHSLNLTIDLIVTHNLGLWPIVSVTDPGNSQQKFFHVPPRHFIVIERVFFQSLCSPCRDFTAV